MTRPAPTAHVVCADADADSAAADAAAADAAAADAAEAGAAEAGVAAAPVDGLLERAARRARAAGRPYLGDATPAEAWALHRSGAARLVDVRTQAEWLYVGHVEDVPLVEWRAFGARDPNPRFLEQLAEAVPRDVPVLLLCRSGVRSQSAAKAATEAGWRSAINVLEGFEGDLDETQRRGRLGGWRAAGLPWVQS